MNREFLEEYAKVLKDPKRQVEFCKAGIDDDKRVFKVINSNIKTYNTFYKYLKELVNDPNKDHHQSIFRLKVINLYTQKNNESIKNRMNIALKIEKNFKPGSFIRDFMIFAFSLNTKSEVEKSIKFIIKALPESILINYDRFLKDAIKNKSISNPIFGLYVFYSDKELLYKYLEYVTNLNLEKRSILENIETEENFVYKRIKDMQKGAILNEAILASMYFKLSTIELEKEDKYENIIKKIIIEYKKWAKNLNMKNCGSLQEWEKLERLLLKLDENEKIEILKCFKNVPDNLKNCIPSFSK